MEPEPQQPASSAAPSTTRTVRSRVLRGIGANAFGQAVNTLIQLVGLPVFLAVWGVELYGEWLVLTSLASFLAMSDVGFASAAANEMTMRSGRDDRDGALVVYQSAWALLCVLGGAMLAIVLAVLWFTRAATWLPLTAIPAGDATVALSIMAVSILLSQQLGVLQAGFRCGGRYPLGVTIGTLTRLTEFVAQIAALLATGSIVWVAAAGVLARLAAFFATAHVLRNSVPWLRLGIAHAEASSLVKLAAPAIAYLGMPLAYAISNQGTIQVIAAILGPVAVTAFAAHRTIANVAVQAMTLVNQSVRPEMSLAFGNGDLDTARKLNRRTCQVTLWLALASCVVILVVATPLFALWTRNAISADYPLLIALLSAVVLRSGWLSSYVVPSAINQHVRIAGVFVLSTFASLAIATWLTNLIGMVGAGLSLTLAEAFMTWFVVSCSMRMLNERLCDFVQYIVCPPNFLALLVQRTSPRPPAPLS